MGIDGGEKSSGDKGGPTKIVRDAKERLGQSGFGAECITRSIFGDQERGERRWLGRLAARDVSRQRVKRGVASEPAGLP